MRALSFYGFWAAIIAACWMMAGCASNLPDYGQACNEVYARTFWASLSGGGADGSAQAWANYHAHEAAERCRGGK